MKTFLKLTTLATLVLSSTTHAKTAWVEGPLWKAPQETNFTLKLKGKEKLASNCSLYKRVVYKEDGSLSSIARDGKRLKEFRRLFQPIIIEVDQKTWPRLEKEIVADVLSENDSDKLPYFTQKESITGLLLEEAKNLKVAGDENSYTEVSKKAGLEESIVRLSQSMNGNYILKFEELDVACDLYEGIYPVTAETPAYVVLTDNSVSKIRDFYEKQLFPELYGVVKMKSELLSHKAARIGYRTGKVLEDEFSGMNPEKTEKQIRELMKSLFDSKSLELTSNVIRTETQLHLNLEPGIEANNVQVKLEF